jgi:hypothetical protein
MSERDRDGERRRYRRISARQGVWGKIHTVAAAPIIDLSLGGALLEVPVPLKVGASHDMRLTLSPESLLQVEVTVKRTYVHEFTENEEGRVVVNYRSAVEFVTIPETHEKELLGYIRRSKTAQFDAELVLGELDSDFFDDGEAPFDSGRRARAEVTAQSEPAEDRSLGFLDVSPTGMMLHAPVPLAVGSELRCTVSVGDKELGIEGEVSSCEPLAGAGKPAGYHVAIEFRNLADQDREALMISLRGK